MIKHNLASMRERKGNGISKAHLARQIGVDRSYITRLEQFKVQPSSEIMFKIANYFGYKVDDIFKYFPEKEK